MSEVPEGMVKVKVTANHKDDETQLTYYNGDEPVITADEASRMVNMGRGEILEEGGVTDEAYARQDQAEEQQE